MQRDSRQLITELRQKWSELKELGWPGLPPYESSLNEPACDLMQQDSFVAGCISRLVNDGRLDERFWAVLVVDEELTSRIAATDDPQKDDFLHYKSGLDECIRLARDILGIPKP